MNSNLFFLCSTLTQKQDKCKIKNGRKKVEKQSNCLLYTSCDILSGKNGCEGVLIRDEEGKLVPVYARDVIWACGGIGGIYDNSTNFPHLTGDALAIAIHRNVALKNVNYVQILSLIHI